MNPLRSRFPDEIKCARILLGNIPVLEKVRRELKKIGIVLQLLVSLTFMREKGTAGWMNTS